MSLEIIAGCGVFGVLAVLLMMYAMLKNKVNNIINIDLLTDLLEGILDNIGTNQELQQKIFLLGAVIGKGIQQGVGLNTRGRKANINDFIGLAIQQFAPKLLGNLSGAVAGEAVNQISNQEKKPQWVGVQE